MSQSTEPTVELNFKMRQGDTKNILVTVKDPAGVAISLVGALSIKWWMAKKVTSAVRTLEKSVALGTVTVLDAAGGQLKVPIIPADTAALHGEFYHELEVIDSAGDIGTVLDGTITINKALIPNP